MSEEQQVEQKILAAAKKVFYRRGYFGSRMQEIADEAGINKAMLHYYFRSKDKLFETTINEALSKLFDRMDEIFEYEGGFESKLKKFVHNYISAIRENPHLPAFIIHEMYHNRERFEQKIFDHTATKKKKFLVLVEEEIEKGNIKDIPPEHVLVNVISLCIFPFVGRPIMEMLNVIAPNKFDEFIEKRIEILPELIFNGIRK
jgi:AcrR family transcriptional regulator